MILVPSRYNCLGTIHSTMARMQLLLVASVLLLRLCASLNDDARGSSPSPSFGDSDGIHVNEHIKEQEMLVGKGEKRRLDELPPEEAKKELRKLIGRIDLDGDTYLSHNELVSWLVKMEEGYEERDRNEQFRKADLDRDGSVTFEEMLKGFGLGDDADLPYTEEFLENDRVKFDKADTDGDGVLSKAEFGSFIHPTQDNMVGYMIQEHLKKYDMDKDGMISLEEYMAIFSPSGTGDDTPQWVLNEKKEFEEELDHNKDGKLDEEEMREWLVPDNIKFAAEEADFLLDRADKDEDDQLSVQEIMQEFDFFMDSELTEFGGHTVHDEL